MLNHHISQSVHRLNYVLCIMESAAIGLIWTFKWMVSKTEKETLQ